MSFSSLPEDEKNVKTRGETYNLFGRRKTEIPEVIPSLLLVTDDIISPIKVVFDATNKLFSGENFNEKKSLDGALEKEDNHTVNSLPTKKFSFSDMFDGDAQDIKLVEEKSQSPKKSCSGKHKKSDFLKKSNLDKVQLGSGPDNVLERRERRKSDCPARHKARDKLDESPGLAQPGTPRIKSKSIERVVDIELSSLHTAKSPANLIPPVSGESVSANTNKDSTQNKKANTLNDQYIKSPLFPYIIYTYRYSRI